MSQLNDAQLGRKIRELLAGADDVDWVASLLAASPSRMFEKLRVRVEADVNRFNELFQGSRAEFDYNQELPFRFGVTWGTGSVKVSREGAGGVFLVSRAPEQLPEFIKPILTTSGELLFDLAGNQVPVWQASQFLLKPLFTRAQTV